MENSLNFLQALEDDELLKVGGGLETRKPLNDHIKIKKKKSALQGEKDIIAKEPDLTIDSNSEN